MNPALVLIVLMLLLAMGGGAIYLVMSSTAAAEEAAAKKKAAAAAAALASPASKAGANASEYPRVYIEFNNGGWGTSQVCGNDYDKKGGHHFRYSGEVTDYDEKKGNYTVQWDKIETLDDPENCPPKLLYSTSETEGEYWTPDKMFPQTQTWKSFFFGDAETKKAPFYSIANLLKTELGGGMTQPRNKVKIVPKSWLQETETSRGTEMI